MLRLIGIGFEGGLREAAKIRVAAPPPLLAQEILALILGRGISGESVMVTAHRLLSQFGNLRNIATTR